MPIVVGTDTYLSVADAVAYAAKVGGSFSGDTAAQEAALVRATAWIDATYRSRFPGKRASGRDQALEWPRAEAKDAEGEDIGTDEIPQEIEDATAEAAIREIASPGSLSPDVTPGQQKTLVQVEGIRWDSNAIGGAAAQKPVLHVVDGILASLIGSGTGRLLRA